ncbi:MAG: sodium:solute symporter family protein [Candidatus Glassbacteria bacterium]|nr:sodium:solute symporter family protein [Candidatus Glassbacteria bacterium]
MTPLLIIALYLAVSFGIGIFAWWRGRVTADDYYISNRSQGYVVTALAIMATFFSGFAMLGAPGFLFKGGIGFVFFMLNVPICGALIWIIGKPLWRLGKKNNYITPSDLIADYYDSDTLRVLLVLLGIVYIIPYAVLQFKAGGYLFEVITESSNVQAGWFALGDGRITFGALSVSTHVFGALLLASITMIYTILGGMRAVCWTDVFQGGMLVIGMLVGGILVLWKLGGVRGLFEQAAAISVNGTPPGEFITIPGPAGMFPISMIFTFVLVASFGTMVSPSQWMRYYSAKNPAALRRSMIIFTVVLSACYFFGTAFIGLGGKVLFPALEQPDTVYLRIIESYLPLALASFFVTTIMAAAMSTANGNLHAMSALVTKDIYRRFIRSGAGEREMVWVGRTVIATASILSLWIALMPDIGMIVQIGLLSMAVAMQMFPSLIGPLWWKGQTRAATVWGILLGMLALLATFQPAWFGISWFGRSPLGIHYGFWGFAVNLIVIRAVSKFSRPVPAETVARFHGA